MILNKSIIARIVPLNVIVQFLIIGTLLEFIVWLIIGIVTYIVYGRKHSVIQNENS
ncbi:amino acid permease C-terminal domain-containing protein [Clostridium estertheticum]|uniref:amino acid permease C-terminal domain-containing protein n=1 Tax=Clostridium estertheticum TaxID=238834 RepID=UPI001C6DE88D|nr:amino acid permease C-terminal domain-containing protein [Clostridium estertheticum]MBW9153094.1 hypothetical protein [Clostridium estertheticum]WLC82549.1 hypothetical protein KTC97_10330 [Clostridium estertheticum]